MAFEYQGKKLVSLNPLEVISCPLVQAFDGQACSPQTSQTLISLKAAVLVGVGDLQPEMSPSTSTELISAGSRGPAKQGRGHLNGRAVWADRSSKAAVAGWELSTLPHWCDKQRWESHLLSSLLGFADTERVCKGLRIWCGDHMAKQAVHVSS